MRIWPGSKPDYKWPPELLAGANAPRRVLASFVFHLGHAAGRCVGLMRPEKPAVLVIRTDGIGDAVLFEPMLRSLSVHFADHALHLWAPAGTCELLRAASFIDRLQIIPRGYKRGNLAIFTSFAWRAKLGFSLGRWKFDAAVYPSHSPEPLGNWLLASVRARERWYSPGDTENQFAGQRESTSRAATALLKSEGGGHELARNAELAQRWGGIFSEALPTVHLDEPAYRAANVQSSVWREEARGLNAGAIIGLMPATALATKQYPPEKWAAAITRLWDDEKIICALLGGPTDGKEIERVASLLENIPHLRMAGPLDLPAMAALIGSLDGLVSVDTGLAHLALAQDVPAVILVGGGHPGRFFPWPAARRAITLNHAMPCAGCLGRCHLARAECLTEIQAGQIVAAVARVLQHHASGVSLPLRAAG